MPTFKPGGGWVAALLPSVFACPEVGSAVQKRLLGGSGVRCRCGVSSEGLEVFEWETLTLSRVFFHSFRRSGPVVPSAFESGRPTQASFDEPPW